MSVNHLFMAVTSFVWVCVHAVGEESVRLSHDYLMVRDEMGVLLHGIDSNDNDGEASEARDARSLLSDLVDGETFDKIVLDRHNKLREDTAQGILSYPAGSTNNQPTAAMMNSLQWDPALAKAAQDWADNCWWGHSSSASRVASFESYGNMATFKYDTLTMSSWSIGENLYAVTHPGQNLEQKDYILDGLQSLFDEYLDYTFETQTCAANKQCGHYTQMVWADTRYIGCAYSVCNNPSLDNTGWSTEALYLVCNYFPAGNYNGQHPYVQGVPCTECDTDRKTCTNGQCSGCMFDEFNFCSVNRWANCDKDFTASDGTVYGNLQPSCPSDCNLESTNWICADCRGACDACDIANVEVPQTCSDGTEPMSDPDPETTSTSPDGPETIETTSVVVPDVPDTCPLAVPEITTCQDDPNCERCRNNGVCRRCKSGYVKMSPANTNGGFVKVCMSCDQNWPGCADCANNVGCNSACQAGYTWTYSTDCGQNVCRKD